ncbi:MAG: hypothetical protein VB855_13245 [Pirellulaceae bacterium]
MAHETPSRPTHAGNRTPSRSLPAVLALTFFLLPATVLADIPSPARAETDRTFQQDLEKLALRCDDLDLVKQARITRQLAAQGRPDQNRIFVPSLAGDLRPPAAAGENAMFWYTHLRQHCQAQASRLFPIASQLSTQGDATGAYRLLHEILFLDPSHRQAAKILGLGRSSARPRAVQARAPHPQLGWPARRYWTITSRHFQIVTNHSARAGVDLAEQLEMLHVAWRQLMFPLWSNAELLSKRWQDPAVALGPEKKHQVVLFADRKEYVETLSANQSRIHLTSGIYQYDAATAFFYTANPAPTTIWNHEITHQLMQEMRPAVSEVGKEQNFWIVEGIALYMESLQRHDCYLTVGGFESNRLQYARYRRLTEKFYIPLQRLVLMGRDQVQMDDKIRRLYSQSSGLTHLLMDGNGGEHRQALMEYLDQVYRGEDDSHSIAELTGRTMGKLDDEYGRFLVVQDQDLLRLPPGLPLENLVLGGCPVSDQGLQRLAGQQHLRWLDLTGTMVSDKGFSLLAESTRLEQLSLERTRITDRSLEVLAGMKELEELDLSSTGVTDKGIASLSGLRQLKQLWLTGTMVSDKGLRHLEPLKQLELLELSGTDVSQEGLKALRATLPRLKEN